MLCMSSVCGVFCRFCVVLHRLSLGFPCIYSVACALLCQNTAAVETPRKSQRRVIRGLMMSMSNFKPKMKKTLLTMTAIAGLGFAIASQIEEIPGPTVYGTYMNNLNQLTLAAAPDREVKTATVRLVADQKATVTMANLKGEKIGNFTTAPDKLNQLLLAAAPDSEIEKPKRSLLNEARSERLIADFEAKWELHQKQKNTQ
jgi:hypothetical protein